LPHDPARGVALHGMVFVVTPIAGLPLGVAAR